MKRERLGFGGLVVCCALVLVLITPASATPGTLEVVLETDAMVYRLPDVSYPGDEVLMTVSLHNNTEQELRFWDYHIPWNIGVYAYDDVAGLDPEQSPCGIDPVFLAFGTGHEGPPYVWLELDPGESWEAVHSWSLMDSEGDLVSPGEYRLIFVIPDPSCSAYGSLPEGVVVDRSEMGKWVTVVPEPVTLALLGVGGVLLLRRRGDAPLDHRCCPQKELGVLVEAISLDH